MTATLIVEGGSKQSTRASLVSVRLAFSEFLHKSGVENVNIIVNPKMAQKLWEISENFKQEIQGLENIRVIEDASVGSDGTIVESVKNRIDATIKNQINVIADELFRELNFTSEEKLVEEIEND